MTKNKIIMYRMQGIYLGIFLFSLYLLIPKIIDFFCNHISIIITIK